jgi:hypothetical protein
VLAAELQPEHRTPWRSPRSPPSHPGPGCSQGIPLSPAAGFSSRAIEPLAECPPDRRHVPA